MKKTLDRILQEQKSRTKLSLLICLSLFAVSAVLLLNGQVFGWAFFGMGTVMAAAIWQRLRRNRQELARLGDPGRAEAMIESRDTAYYPSFGLTVSPEFVILEKPVLQICLLSDMEKFEVGLAGDVRKVLFLTDPNGQRHPVAESRKGEDHEEEFDRAYRQIRDIFAKRNQKTQN